MANEFIARNGLIAQNNSIVTGSLNVSAGITGSALAIGITTPLGTTKAHIKGIVGIENGSTAGNLADQLLFGYSGAGLSQYNHKIQTSHDAQAALNKMDFLVSNGASTFLNTLTLRSSGLSKFDSGQGLGVSGSLQVTGSLNVSGGITGSLLGTASFVSTLRSTGSIGSIQYANNGVLGSSTNLNYNGTNLLLQNGKIYQSDGTTYFTVLGKTGTVGTNETGVWGYDGDLDNIYPITSYDIASNKYYFANYSTVYDGATGFLGIGTSTPAAKLHVLGNITASGNITAQTNLISANSSGDEGGEILLAKPVTNNSLVGSGITIDSFQNRLRFFEQGGNARGGYLDITSLGNGVSTDLRIAQHLESQQAMGSTIKGYTIGCPFPTLATGGQTLSGGVGTYIAVYIHTTTTITGVKFQQFTQGVYTANNYNGVGLYSTSAGTLNLVASSSNDGNLWTGASNSFQSKSFTSTYSAAPGIYYICALWSTSSPTTSPAISFAGSAASTTANLGVLDFTNSNKMNGTAGSGLTALATSQAASGIAATQHRFAFYLF